jgi:hypothetical protein
MSKFTEIHFDMDGVLCDFKGRVELLAGKRFELLSSKEMWTIVNKDEKFFENLRPNQDMLDLMVWCTIHTNCSIRVLSATGHNHHAVAEQKYNWLKSNAAIALIERAKFVPSSDAKRFHAHSKAILIDDSPRSINPWCEYGGVGILHVDFDTTFAKLKKLLAIS